MTNADKIRSMTDEELAEWLDECADCNICKKHPTQCDVDCYHGYLEWLQQEAPDTEPKPPAHWILADNGEAVCSRCGANGDTYMKYCPMCGTEIGGIA